MKPKIKWPTEEEDRKITAAALADPDNPPLDEEFFKTAKRGRPPMPAETRKKSVHVMLDPDVIERLKEGGRGWQTRLNAALREALGL